MRLRRLSGVDLREDLLVGRKAIRLLVGVGRLAVDVDFEDPAHAFLQPGGEAVLALDGGLQTGGLGEVVSLPAVEDLDVHGSSLPPDRIVTTLYMTGRGATAIPCWR